MVALVCSALFAAWSWFRPYEWKPDPGARCKVVVAQVKRDLSHFWVDVHLRMLPGEGHDLMKPVRLVTAAGRELEPADTTLAGDGKSGTTDLWLKFWLEKEDMEGGLSLRINDGTLVIKKNDGIPRLGGNHIGVFPSSRW